MFCVLLLVHMQIAYAGRENAFLTTAKGSQEDVSVITVLPVCNVVAFMCLCWDAGVSVAVSFLRRDSMKVSTANSSEHDWGSNMIGRI